MSNPVPEPTKPPQGPAGPSPTGPTPEAEAPDSVMNSPFAKMFEKSGEPLTKKQLQAIINQFVKDLINRMKHDEKRMKEASERLKKAIKGQS